MFVGDSVEAKVEDLSWVHRDGVFATELDAR